MKSEGRHKEIQAELQKLKTEIPSPVPKDLAYCEKELFDDYMHDMFLVQRFAQESRYTMIRTILFEMGWSYYLGKMFDTIHNYISEDGILRKGAVSAKYGEIFLLPINMRDGSWICRGKGNSDWNYSAPHGAGRLMSRTKAKEEFTVERFRDEMKFVFSSTVNESTLDECPMAYKPMHEIIENIAPTAELIDYLRPIYNFKAGDNE